MPYLADVDGDGRHDLLVGSRTLEDTDDERFTITVHVARSVEREGEDTFAEVEQVLDLGRSEHPVTGVGDFDGDGDDDLFRATNTLRGNGVTQVRVEAIINDDGTFTAHEPTELDVDVWGVGWFVAGDPDGDGQDEVVVTNGRRGSIGVLEQADGAFGEPAEWWAGSVGEKDWERTVFREGAPWFRQALSDVDGDGDDDLVALARVADDNGIAVGVATSDGSGFAEYEEWGSLPCATDPCPAYELVANVEPSIL
ncbi:FG-GAP-like repeat-containing protein [Nocardioides sp. TF02-7]|uniref:FG-GAP-like repeat-containing protein n=1 Tax=Nocardioides sp. TF02-7 TaxID=2917724 RepID=UPI001F05471D|nr:FG-GAP-like repeat-containing protein [Nocardioides sp. TF02-7]UMG94621.1 FG-GAP-like repeat-containing protein [Nocardioides sp. TF02-7]